MQFAEALVDNVIYRETGRLIPGVFYRFKVQFSDDVDDSDYDKTWIVSRRNPTSDELDLKPDSVPRWAWISLGEDLDRARRKHDCPLDKAHVTASYPSYPKEPVAEIFGARLSDFVPDADSNLAIVNETLAERLKRSGLTGLSFTTIATWEHVNERPGAKLSIANFEGRDCRRGFEVAGAPNACPFCGRKPLICPACGYGGAVCPDCGKHTLTWTHLHQGAGDRRLKGNLEGFHKKPIVEGKRWDGSDFSYNRSGGIITRRALDWLLGVHAAPFYVQPMLVDIEGMTDEQLAKLEAARKPLPIKTAK
jgi:hypothetical protein